MHASDDGDTEIRPRAPLPLPPALIPALRAAVECGYEPEELLERLRGLLATMYEDQRRLHIHKTPSACRPAWGIAALEHSGV